MPRVLMIEDDFDFAEIMIECLQADPNCSIDEIITNEADARFKMEWTQLKGIDAVLVDLHLCKSKSDPRINPTAGLDLVAEMRQKYRYRGRVIVLTNSNSLVDGQRAWAAGCDGYLCKHVRAGDLANLISELRMALRGDVVIVSQEMRHIFMRPTEVDASVTIPS